MLKIIGKSFAAWLVMLILTAGCSQSPTLASPSPPAPAIVPTRTFIAALSTSLATLAPTPSLPTTVLGEVSKISFDEYNSILGSEPVLVSQKVAISPDGKILATVGDLESYIRNIDGNVFLWNMDNPDQSLKAFQSSISHLESITFSNSGKYIAVGGCTQKDCLTSKIVIFDWTTGMVIHTLESEGAQIIQLKFTPDDENVVAQDITGEISYWNLSSGQVIHPPIPNAQYAGAHGFAISPLGDRIVISALDGVHVFELPMLTSIELRTGLGGEVGLGSPVALSHDGKRLIASGCGEFSTETCVSREIFIWGSENSKPERVIALGKIYIVALQFNGDSEIFAMGTPFGITMWKISSGEKLRSPYSSQTTMVLDIVFNPNGENFAALTDKGILLGQVAED